MGEPERGEPKERVGVRYSALASKFSYSCDDYGILESFVKEEDGVARMGAEVGFDLLWGEIEVCEGACACSIRSASAGV